MLFVRLLCASSHLALQQELDRRISELRSGGDAVSVSEYISSLISSVDVFTVGVLTLTLCGSLLQCWTWCLCTLRSQCCRRSSGPTAQIPGQQLLVCLHYFTSWDLTVLRTTFSVWLKASFAFLFQLIRQKGRDYTCSCEQRLHNWIRWTMTQN